MKRLLLLLVLLAVALPGQAGAAASPCANRIFNDWLADGKIASTYPLGCYRNALKNMPADAGIYSSLSEDLHAAMRAAMRRATGHAAPQQVGHGFKALGSGQVKGTLAAIHTAKAPPHDPVRSDSVGVVAAAEKAPLPILVLGGIAVALVAAGAIGTGVRHARSRR